MHETTEGNVCVWGDGPKKSRVMIIGEAPGAEEAKTGKPFQGKSGQLLRAELHAVGLDDVYISNVVKCRPPDNRTPSTKEQKACRGYLDEELDAVNPEYVLTLGNPATKAIFGKAKITEIHGQLLTNKHGIKGVPAFHPAYVLRDPTKKPQFQTDLKRFADLVNGKRSKSTVKYRILGWDNLEEFFEEFKRTLWYSFDIETNSLKWFAEESKIHSIAFAFETTGEAWVMPLRLEIGEYKSPFFKHADAQGVLERIERIARSMKKKAVGQNGKFDNLFLMAKYRVRMPLAFDVMLAHHTIDENSNHDLKGLQRQYIGEPDYDLDKDDKVNPKDHDQLFEYNAKDAVYTLRLKKIFKAELEKDPVLIRLFVQLIMRAARAFEQIEFNGMYVNLVQMAAMEKQVLSELKTSQSDLDRMSIEACGRKINFNSPDQVAELFFEHLELPIIHQTAGGKPSTAEATLVDLKDEHPIVDKLVKYRELEKFRGTYLDGWKDFMIGPCLYMGYKLHGTVTGRYSSRLHSTPRDGTVRNIVEAPPGWIFVQGDLSQAEVRVVASLSMDPELVTCYTRGIDVHWRTLMALLADGTSDEYTKPALETGKALGAKGSSLHAALDRMLAVGADKCTSLWKGWKEARKKTKGVVFGYIYGMGWFKFIEYAKAKYGFEPTERESKDTRDAFFRLYNRLETWHNKQRSLVRLDGFVRNLAGRKRRLPGIFTDDKKLQKECERQAINSPVQGIIGDWKAMALVEIVEELDWNRTRVVGEHHDALLFWIREEHLQEEAKKIARIMRRPKLVDEFNMRLHVPMEVELEAGVWGAGKKLEV